jgi:nucleotide-binding universal stress UspA family protein
MTDSVYRIVVGYDFSDTADLALAQAFELASRESRSEVHVLHVTVPVVDVAYTGALAVSAPEQIPIRDIYESLEARVGQRMAGWQAQTGRTFNRLVIHVRTDVPSAETAQLASDLEANLVVVGTHGRQGLKRLILGSVAEAVVRLAPCPVLVVRPREIAPEGPKIEPPCPRCVEARKASGGEVFWCEQHLERHGQRHVYHRSDRTSQPANPAFFYGER